MIAIGAQLRTLGYDVAISLAEPYAPLATAAGLKPYSLVDRQQFDEMLSDPAMWKQVRGMHKVIRGIAAGFLESHFEVIRSLHRPGRTVLVSHPLDFAARIFVTFEYDIKKLPLGERIKYRTFKLFGYDEVPLRAINYIWANKAMAGTVVNNAHTSWVKMIAVRDNTTPLNSWISEERNIYEDYEKAFGEKPGAITSIAIMTDTDNTGESTMAYFGDILLSKDG